jgi:hypothetical protein
MQGPATRLAHLLLAAGWLSATAAPGRHHRDSRDSATGAPIASALVKAVAPDAARAHPPSPTAVASGSPGSKEAGW